MTAVYHGKVDVSANADALAGKVADWLLGLALAKDGNFAISLSGGSTPRRLYETLAGDKYISSFPWNRVHWFWGDERCVPHDDPQSNYRMTREALLDRAPIPSANIHAIQTEGMMPDAMANAYEQTLKSYYGADVLSHKTALFDAVLLGLGEDGHTASLFPETNVLSEKTRWVSPVPKTPSEMRITLTYPVLESSAYTAFLITGQSKRDVFQRFLAGDKSLPSARLSPTGTTTLFVDDAVV